LSISENVVWEKIGAQKDEIKKLHSDHKSSKIIRFLVGRPNVPWHRSDLKEHIPEIDLDNILQKALPSKGI
jgi:hypothetical protein